ncbi:uncharacterized protein LOC113294650 [Papaver somniferum]|uniref:uncharacterized protein LOC113294650 n=1 Tax=Papaver somniferum TaxID=3469 RepID=UPI000E6FAA43|nr:uncharacterized protein LOC113294650 [Papaver somniferum]
MICELEDDEGNIVADQDKIEDVLFFHHKFQNKEVTIDDSLLDVIPQLISDQDQVMIEAVPELEEIKNAVFSMNADGAPGPDSFSVLLPKVQGAKKPNQFRPIGLRNFNFKIFTKILATRMNNLMGKLVSNQQAAYIKGRSIHQQVMLASELVNEMKHTRRGGNVGLKLDISQAYDSVNWNFLFKVLQKYGFSAAWCEWLKVLFASAKISVMINGGPQDDVFIFSNGSKKSLEALITLLKTYQDSSGQIINKQKSKCFVEDCTPSRRNQIVSLMQMELTTFPGKYLGVILKPGRVKSATV